MLTFLRKIKKLRFRKFGAKDAALFFINKKLPGLGGDQKFGKLTDLSLDRRTKTISLEVSRDKKLTPLTLKITKLSSLKANPG